MHAEQRQFLESVKARFPAFFSNVKVYDFGSQDINGNNRWLFDGGEYTGIDIVAGANVDIVGRAHEVELPGLADVCISGEMLEHDEYWPDSLLAMARWCRPGGLMVFTCAAPGRPEHGTFRQAPEASPGTLEYYRNLSQKDVEWVLPVDELFSSAEFSVNPATCDLYFWGIRHAVALPDISKTT